MYTSKEMLAPLSRKLLLSALLSVVQTAAFTFVPLFGFSQRFVGLGGAELAMVLLVNVALNFLFYYLFLSGLVGIIRSLKAPASAGTFLLGVALVVAANPVTVYTLSHSLNSPTDQTGAPAPAPTANCGATVVSFASFSQAGASGLAAGDIVTAFDGQRLTSVRDLIASLADRRPGDIVQLTVARGIFAVPVVADPEKGGAVLGIKFKDAACPAPRSENITYVNDQYGFEFVLPDSWTGYSIVVGGWESYTLGAAGQVPGPSGVELLIRHPGWTASAPRQDIPIMVFTLRQWDDLRVDKFHIGAAPVNPIELGRNGSFVFALPARYDYAFPLGYEEVERILASGPLRAF